ncbi:MAG: hypothetical protein ABI488_08000 [Polyangiaceae bacterium]
MSDVHTERLAVLLSLISLVADLEDVSVLCSAREFDFRHDSRFANLDAQEIRLAPLPQEDVDRVLGTVGLDASRVPAKLKSLLAIPQWLKLFMKQSWAGEVSLPLTAQALLETMWTQQVSQPTAFAAENDRAASELAKAISQREELWLARGGLAHLEPALQRLLSAGVLTTDRSGLRVSFAHQSSYEFARARAFVREESLTAYVLTQQGSLFVRPTMWTALQYLRSADPPRFRVEINALWAAALRPHVRLLLVEFIAQVPDPDDFEFAFLVPVFEQPRWAAAAFNATVHSEGWLRRLRRGPLQAAMLSTRAETTYGALVASLKHDRDGTLELIANLWGGRTEWAGLVIAVMRQLNNWTPIALDLVTEALAVDLDALETVDSFAWQLRPTAPAYAIELVARHLERRFSKQEPVLPQSPPLAEDAAEADQFRWYREREPRKTIEEIFNSASRIHVLIDLAEAEPELFLRRLVPWVARVLAHAVEDDRWHPSYRQDYICDCARTGHVSELPHALRAASEKLARTAADRFWALCDEWTASDLHIIHVIFSYGIELVDATSVDRVVTYLLGDPRRLRLGERSDHDARTVALLRSLNTSLHLEPALRLQTAIIASERSSESGERDARGRAFAHRVNREHRVRLLQALPHTLLSGANAALLEQELRVFGEEDHPSGRTIEMQQVRSPMSAKQMERAANPHVLNLFRELPDSTGHQDPKRFHASGAFDASREFAEFAKQNTSRAIQLIDELQPGVNEIPAGAGVEALADTTLPTAELGALVVRCHERGFASEQFRCNAARALEKRAAAERGLPQALLDMLCGWLDDVPYRARTIAHSASEEHSGSPPFLLGFGGIMMPPGGSYPLLDALRVALLSEKPHRSSDWLSLLTHHLERDEDPLIWKAFVRRLEWLRTCEKAAAREFLLQLFQRYPEALESGHCAHLVAIASWWVDEETIHAWVRSIGASKWKHASRARGELTAFLATRARPLAWAVHELQTILSGDLTNHDAIGAAHVLAGMWEDAATRGHAAPFLEVLARRGSKGTDDALLRRLGNDDLAGDNASAEVLRAFSEREAPPPLELAHEVVPWLARMVQLCPALVCAVLERMVSAAAADGAPGMKLGGASLELVNIAVTLQRIPAFREKGLTLFEQLLELNLYGVRQALDDIDSPRS